MTIKLQKSTSEFQYKDSEAYLKRQQDIDAALVLTHLLDPTKAVTQELVEKARTKISQLIDKI